MNGLLNDGTYWLIYIMCLVIWTIFIVKTKNPRENGKRKTLMLATWNEPSDPTSFIIEDMNVTKTVQYVKELNESQKEQRITLTHVLGHGLAWGLYKMRRDVGRLTWGFFKYNQGRIGITILVDVEGGSDLVPITLWNAHELTLIEFAAKCNEKVSIAKNKKDVQHNKSTASAAFVPSFLLQPILSIGSYINVNLNIPIPQMGLHKESVGHYVLTNIGSLGMQQGFAPICPPLRMMGLTCAGKVVKTPWVVDDKIVIQDIMNTTQTGDHRYGDASIWVPMHRAFKGYMEDAKNFDPTIYKENVHYSEKKTA